MRSGKGAGSGAAVRCPTAPDKGREIGVIDAGERAGLEGNLDMIAANEVGDDKVFDKDDNALLVLWRGGRTELAPASKRELARQLVDLIGERCAATGGRDSAVG